MQIPFVYLGLGSNISPRLEYIKSAIALLKKSYQEEFLVSSLYGTDPYQGLEQDRFYNCVARFKTKESPKNVLARIGEIETTLGRQRGKQRWSARTIDIDILLFRDQIVSDEALIIPHYDLMNRDFFLVPLTELDENLVDPQTGDKLAEALQRLPRNIKTNLNQMSEINLN